MNYKYSICHFDKPNIEYLPETFDRYRLVEIIKNHKWQELLLSMSNLKNEEIYFNPSLDFTDLSDNRSLCLTASLENGELEFSLWYNRPVKSRSFFGLLVERTKMKVIDKWGFSLDKALECFELFLDKNYRKLELKMAKN